MNLIMLTNNQFFMKIKENSAFEQLNDININVSELPSNDKVLSPKYILKNYYENREIYYLLLYENHYCLKSFLHNFCLKKLTFMQNVIKRI